VPRKVIEFKSAEGIDAQSDAAVIRFIPDYL